MYDIDTSNIKKGRKIYLILMIAGLVLLLIIGMFLSFRYKKIGRLDAQTTSIKVEVDSYIGEDGITMYSPTYYYKVNGRRYECKISESSNIDPGTSNKTIYYNSKKPTECMTDWSKKASYIFIILLILPLTFIILAGINILKINKRLIVIKELNERGKLIKKLPYTLQDTGLIINNVPIKKIVVNYTLASGTPVELHSDPRYDKKNSGNDAFVDLVIDENNPKNYYIDYEINRLTGNLDTDYYKNKNTNNW